MDKIDYLQVREELQKKNLYDIQRELTVQRRTRTGVMSILVLALVFTFVYGTLEDPFVYTLSNIGNFFNYRVVFIIWSIVSALAIEFAVLALFKLEEYPNRTGYTFIYIATVLIIITGIVPALKETYPLWHYIHTGTSGALAIALYIAIVPFSKWVSKENPRLRKTIIVWQIAIWIGSILMIVLYWHSALFEIWFFVSTILFLLYLSLVLFEEKIIKISVKLMMDEENLNLAIEKIFVNLESIDKQRKQNNTKRNNGSKA